MKKENSAKLVSQNGIPHDFPMDSRWFRWGGPHKYNPAGKETMAAISQFLAAIHGSAIDQDSKLRQEASSSIVWQNLWQSLRQHKYKLLFLVSHYDQPKIPSATDSDQKSSPTLTPAQVYANILSGLNVTESAEREELWSHLNADYGHKPLSYFKQYRDLSNGFVKSNADSPFSTTMNEILMTPQYREEFAKQCPELQLIVTYADADAKQPQKLITPDQIQKKWFWQRWGARNLTDKYKDVSGFKTTITQQLIDKPYFAGQYWMKFRDDPERLRVLFGSNHNQQALLLAQVNLEDPKDRRRFYAYLAHDDCALFKTLNDNGGLYAATQPAWAGLANVLKTILSTPNLTQEFFRKQRQLARTLRPTDFALTWLLNPRLAAIAQLRRGFFRRDPYGDYPRYLDIQEADQTPLKTLLSKVMSTQLYQVLSSSTDVGLNQLLREHVVKNDPSLLQKLSGEQLFNLLLAESDETMSLESGQLSSRLSLKSQILAKPRREKDLLEKIALFVEPSLADSKEAKAEEVQSDSIREEKTSLVQQSSSLMRHQQFIEACISGLSSDADAERLTSICSFFCQFDQPIWPGYTQELIQKNSALRNLAYQQLRKTTAGLTQLIDFASQLSMSALQDNISEELQQLVQKSQAYSASEKTFLDAILSSRLVITVTKSLAIPIPVLEQLDQTTRDHLWKNNCNRTNLCDYYKTNDRFMRLALAKPEKEAKEEQTETVTADYKLNREIAITVLTNLTVDEFTGLLTKSDVSYDHVFGLILSEPSLLSRTKQWLIDQSSPEPAVAIASEEKKSLTTQARLATISPQLQQFIQAILTLMYQSADSETIRPEKRLLDALLSRQDVGMLVPVNTSSQAIPISNVVLSHLNVATIANLWKFKLYQSEIHQFHQTKPWLDLVFSEKLQTHQSFVTEVMDFETKQSDTFIVACIQDSRCSESSPVFTTFSTQIAAWVQNCRLPAAIETIKQLISKKALDIDAIITAFAARISDQSFLTTLFGCNEGFATQITALKKYPKLKEIIEQYEQSLQKQIQASALRVAAASAVFSSSTPKASPPPLSRDKLLAARVQLTESATMDHADALMVRLKNKEMSDEIMVDSSVFIQTAALKTSECIAVITADSKYRCQYYQQPKQVSFWLAFPKAVKLWEASKDSETSAELKQAQINLSTIRACLKQDWLSNETDIGTASRQALLQWMTDTGLDGHGLQVDRGDLERLLFPVAAERVTTQDYLNLLNLFGQDKLDAGARTQVKTLFAWVLKEKALHPAEIKELPDSASVDYYHLLFSQPELTQRFVELNLNTPGNIRLFLAHADKSSELFGLILLNPILSSAFSEAGLMPEDILFDSHRLKAISTLIELDSKGTPLLRRGIELSSLIESRKFTTSIVYDYSQLKKLPIKSVKRGEEKLSTTDYGIDYKTIEQKFEKAIDTLSQEICSLQEKKLSTEKVITKNWLGRDVVSPSPYDDWHESFLAAIGESKPQKTRTGMPDVHALIYDAEKYYFEAASAVIASTSAGQSDELKAKEQELNLIQKQYCALWSYQIVLGWLVDRQSEREKNQPRAFYCLIRLLECLLQTFANTRSIFSGQQDELVNRVLTQAMQLLELDPIVAQPLCYSITAEPQRPSKKSTTKLYYPLMAPLTSIVALITKNNSTQYQQMALDILRSPDLCQYLNAAQIYKLAVMSPAHAKAAILYKHLRKQEVFPSKDVRKLDNEQWEKIFTCAGNGKTVAEVLQTYSNTAFMQSFKTDYPDFCLTHASVTPPVLESKTAPTLLPSSASEPAPASAVSVSSLTLAEPLTAETTVHTHTHVAPSVLPSSSMPEAAPPIDDQPPPAPPMDEEAPPDAPPMDDVPDAPPMDRDAPSAPGLKQNDAAKKPKESKEIVNPRAGMFDELLSLAARRNGEAKRGVSDKKAEKIYQYELGIRIFEKEESGDKIFDSVKAALNPVTINKPFKQQYCVHLLIKNLSSDKPEFYLIYNKKKESDKESQFIRAEYQIVFDKPDQKAAKIEPHFFNKHPSLAKIAAEKLLMIKTAAKKIQELLIAETDSVESSTVTINFKRFQPPPAFLKPAKKIASKSDTASEVKEGGLPKKQSPIKSIDINGVMRAAFDKTRPILKAEHSDDEDDEFENDPPEKQEEKQKENKPEALPPSSPSPDPQATTTTTVSSSLSGAGFFPPAPKPESSTPMAERMRLVREKRQATQAQTPSTAVGGSPQRLVVLRPSQTSGAGGSTAAPKQKELSELEQRLHEIRK